VLPASLIFCVHYLQSVIEFNPDRNRLLVRSQGLGYTTTKMAGKEILPFNDAEILKVGIATVRERERKKHTGATLWIGASSTRDVVDTANKLGQIKTRKALSCQIFFPSYLSLILFFSYDILAAYEHSVAVFKYLKFLKYYTTLPVSETS
jgi:hypothetical protein